MDAATLNQLARHEAGHAVMAVHLGWGLKYVGIDPPMVEVYDLRDDSQAASERLLIAVSGCAAELICDGKGNESADEYWQRQGCLKDRLEAEKNSVLIQEDPAKARGDALTILGQPSFRRAIEAVATI